MALLVLIALRKQRGLQYLWIQSGTKSCREHFCATHYILHQQDLLWFQKDGATAHAAQISTQVFRTMFLGRLISHFRDITLSACSPDLAVPDYFHWGYVKCEVYETYPANITDLKQRILECIQEIPKEILHCVTTALPSRLQECTEWHGGHLLHTYSMVQSPSWAANWFAVSQEILRISRNPKVQYHTHKRPPPVPILGQPNPVHIPTSHLLEIHPNIIHPSTPRSPQWSLSLRFPHKTLYPPFLTHTRHMPSPSYSSRYIQNTSHFYYRVKCWMSPLATKLYLTLLYSFNATCFYCSQKAIVRHN